MKQLHIGSSFRATHRRGAIIGTLLGAATLCSAATPASAELLTGLTTTNQLVTFDSATPGSILTSVGVTGLQSGETLLGIDFRPATRGLYGLGSTSRLYMLNGTTGVATQVGSAGAFTLSGTSFGFDFNPVPDRIRIVSTTGQNMRINPNNGTLTGVDVPLSYASGDVNAGATPHVAGSAYTNNFPGAVTTTLYGIDTNLDILVTQIPPNNGTLNTVGALGFNTSDLTGFDVSGNSGTAFAALTAPGGNFSQLFTINLSTGAATLVGTIGGGVSIAGLTAAAKVPEPLTWAMMLCGFAMAGAAARRRKMVVRYG